MQKYLFGLALILAINLCGCSSGGDGQQLGGGTSIIENNTDYKEGLQTGNVAAGDMLPDASDDKRKSYLTAVGDAQEGIYTEEMEVQSMETIPELKSLRFGLMGNLDLGTLAYTVPDRDNEDYRLYFFKSEKEEDRYLQFEEMSFNLSEASFVFPDVREGNISIGKFKEIYFMEYTGGLKDNAYHVIVIAVYEKDGKEYYDTRVYEEREKGFVVDAALTQELNEKYYNAKDYPVWDILTPPGENNYSTSVYTKAPNQNSSIRIQYPVFAGDGKDALNNLVYMKVQELAKIDTSFFPVDTGLSIDYQSLVTLQNEKIVSIVFWGTESIEGAAYATDNLISLNIDLQTLDEISFEDLYTADDDFEKIFFEKAYFPTEPFTSYDESGFAEMLKLQSPEYQAVSPFSISGNVSCFLKPEGIVLIMPAIHATGNDHFEAQLNYNDIDKFYKPELKYWDA